MSFDLSGGSDEGGIGKYLEKIGGLDIITAGVLLFGAYQIYSSFSYGQTPFTVAIDPAVIAVQLSGFMALVYLLEYKADEGGSGHGSGGSGYNHSLGQKVEEMASVDALTIAAFALNSYVLYSGMTYSSIDQLTTIGGGTEILTIQISAVMAGIYLLEYKDDDSSGRR